MCNIQITVVLINNSMFKVKAQVWKVICINMKLLSVQV